MEYGEKKRIGKEFVNAEVDTKLRRQKEDTRSARLRSFILGSGAMHRRPPPHAISKGRLAPNKTAPQKMYNAGGALGPGQPGHLQDPGRDRLSGENGGNARHVAATPDTGPEPGSKSHAVERAKKEARDAPRRKRPKQGPSRIRTLCLRHSEGVD